MEKPKRREHSVSWETRTWRTICFIDSFFFLATSFFIFLSIFFFFNLRYFEFSVRWCASLAGHIELPVLNRFVRLDKLSFQFLHHSLKHCTFSNRLNVVFISGVIMGSWGCVWACLGWYWHCDVYILRIKQILIEFSILINLHYAISWPQSGNVQGNCPTREPLSFVSTSNDQTSKAKYQMRRVRCSRLPFLARAPSRPPAPDNTGHRQFPIFLPTVFLHDLYSTTHV